MGHKRLGGEEWDPWVGREGAADNGGVYDSSRSLFGAWGCFRGQVPILGIFYLGIWDIGMGLGGVVDRPTDTLPHGVPGVGPC